MENDKYAPENEEVPRDVVRTRVNQLSDGACQVDREPKAVALMDQIYRMDHVVKRLCHVRDRIQNGNIPMASDAAKQHSLAPTVSAVHTEGPQILQTTFNQMNDILDQIESELF